MSSDSNAEAKKYLLTGVITEPGKYHQGKDRYITVETNKGNKYNCIVPVEYFSNFHEDDILTKCSLNKTENGLYRMIKKPFLTLGVSRIAIERCFVRALRGCSFGNVTAERLCDSIAKAIRNGFTAISLENISKLEKWKEVYDEEGIIAYMTEAATLFRDSGSKAAVDALADIEIFTEAERPFLQGPRGIGPGKAKKLLFWWYKNRCLRRLHFLGLNNTQIKSCQINCDEIYRMVLTKPFTIAPIPMETCFFILESTGVSYTKADVRCGEILRRMHFYTEVGAHACVPIQNIEREFPDFHTHHNQLMGEYGLVMDGRLLYLKYNHEVELYVADYIDGLIKETAINKNIRKEEKEVGPSQQENNYSIKTLTEEQKRAIKGCLRNTISIITGGPGTGKTSITKEIYNNLKLRNITMIAVSFTGKAVVKLNEALESNPANPIAQTMDSLICKAERGNARDDFKVLLIDEASMVTTSLFAKFIRTFTHKYSIIIVGDKCQLPPIGAGHLLLQLLAVARIEIFTLTKNQRLLKPFLNAEEEAKNLSELENKAPSDVRVDTSVIDTLESLMDPNRNLKVPMSFDVSVNNNSDLSQARGFYICEENMDFIREMLEQLRDGGTSYYDITCICPFQKYGHIIALNKIFQEVFKSEKEGIESNGIMWKISDRVMLMKNNYDFGVFNGEEGVITEISELGIKVQFKAKIVKDEIKERNPDYELFFHFHIEDEYELKNLDGDEIVETKWEGDKLHISMIQHSSTLTISKAQGSEYSYVIVYIPDIPQLWNKRGGISNFMHLNLLYVALSRCRITVWAVTTRKILEAISMKKLPIRYDNLAGRLFKMRDPAIEHEFYKITIKTSEKQLRDQQEALENLDIYSEDEDFWNS
jgi:hypothetical protein